MDRGRVGEDRGSQETDGCPLTGVKMESIHRAECDILANQTSNGKTD
jgi:hypothetical protein